MTPKIKSIIRKLFPKEIHRMEELVIEALEYYIHNYNEMESFEKECHQYIENGFVKKYQDE